VIAVELIATECARSTGTRTQVAERACRIAAKILRVSCMTLGLFLVVPVAGSILVLWLKRLES